MVDRIVRPLTLFVLNKLKFIQIAAGLGIAVPTCLAGLTQRCETSTVDNQLSNLKVEFQSETSNPVKEKIIKLLNANLNGESNFQVLAHTNVRADYTIPHTDVHSNFNVSGNHTNTHSNIPAKYVNHHSDSPV